MFYDGKDYWSTKIQVKQDNFVVNKADVLDYDYLIVCKWGGGRPHCMYVHNFDASHANQVQCLNSQGDCEPEPWVQFDDILHIYRVELNASKIEDKF